MYLCSLVDALVLALLLAVAAALALSASQVDAVTGVLGLAEGAVTSSVRWVADSKTGTQAAVRTGVVGSLGGWVLRPLFGLAKRWLRARRDD